MKENYTIVVSEDIYKMNDWQNNYFDVIVDIGANNGIFVLYAGMRHPQARILAYEPCKATYQILQENAWYLNATCFNQALGDGEPLLFHDAGSPCSNLFYKPGESKLQREGSYSVPSRTLTQIFEENAISGRYLIKMDCEGGERFMLNDESCVEIIKASQGFCFEVHFPTVRGHAKFKTFPNWHTWNAWINDNFAITHSILYYRSNRRMGHGVYILKNKDISAERIST